MLYAGAHLSYGLNIHPAETGDEVLATVRTYATEVRARVAPDHPFGLGLRLSATAAEDLEPHAAGLKKEFADAGLYAFTINGFPFGRFHGTRVKEEVYRPDWTTRERLDYTLRLARILAALLPDGVDGSISTSPIAYGKEIPGGAIRNLLRVAAGLADLRLTTGRMIRVALEPDPDCCLETSREAVRFFDELRRRGGREVGTHLGVCLDTCHLAVGFESPAEALRRLTEAGVAVPKIQISAALRVAADAGATTLLPPFADPVYLHQVRVRRDGELARFPDLDPALAAAPEGEWRVHFHVPLHYEGETGLTTTADLIDDEFLRAAVRPGRHLEIETYTFDQLPGRRSGVVDSIAGEFAWLLSRMEKSHP
jgi:sugar phosphate isomerase/epimerase